MSDQPKTLVSPANMEDLSRISGWPFVSPSDEEASGIRVDLTRLRRVAPSPLVGMAAIVASNARRGAAIEIEWPTDLNARRTLHAAGFGSALGEFGDWWIPDETLERPRRILPIIPTQNFRTEMEVESLARIIAAQFRAIDRLHSGLLSHVSDTLSEAAGNVVQHADCEDGGFALVWLRRRRASGSDQWFIEIAVADAGQGIRESLGEGQTDQSAVQLALQDRVTGTDDPHRGWGLAIMAEIASHQGRLLTVHSGNGVVVRDSMGDRPSQAEVRFPGTLVTLSIPAV